MHGSTITRSIGIYVSPLDGIPTVVAVSDDGTSDKVWITFGEVTAEGFSPSYASIQVPRTEVKGVAA